MSTTPTPPSGPWRAGTVTRSEVAWPADAPPVDPAPVADPARRDRRMLLLFGGTAGGIAVIGLVVLLVMLLSGQSSPLRPHYSAPSDNRPPLARLCPPPSAAPAAPGPSGALPVPTGRRTVDRDAGISYRQYDDPWVPWRDYWARGTLQVAYGVGQHFVTEVYSQGTYHASILSGKVPATVNDAITIDLACTGRQVAADVRASYYPQPNQMEMLRDEQAVLGGRPAWVSKFRLHFKEQGLKATSELVAVALIDIGRPEAAILYVSIPNTHTQYDWVIDDVLDSVRIVQ